MLSQSFFPNFGQGPFPKLLEKTLYVRSRLGQNWNIKFVYTTGLLFILVLRHEQKFPAIMGHNEIIAVFSRTNISLKNINNPFL